MPDPMEPVENTSDDRPAPEPSEDAQASLAREQPGARLAALSARPPAVAPGTAQQTFNAMTRRPAGGEVS